MSLQLRDSRGPRSYIFQRYDGVFFISYESGCARSFVTRLRNISQGGRMYLGNDELRVRQTSFRIKGKTLFYCRPSTKSSGTDDDKTTGNDGGGVIVSDRKQE